MYEEKGDGFPQSFEALGTVEERVSFWGGFGGGEAGPKCPWDTELNPGQSPRAELSGNTGRNVLGYCKYPGSGT